MRDAGASDRHARAPRRTPPECWNAPGPQASSAWSPSRRASRVRATALARAERTTACSPPRHAPARGRRARRPDELRAAARASEAPSRSARPVSTTSATTRRTTRQQRLFEPSSRSHSSWASRSSSTPAPPTTTRWRGSRLRRHRRPALLLVAAAARAGARARLVRLVRRQRHLQERVRPPRRGAPRPGRPAPRRDRQPISRASAGRGRRNEPAFVVHTYDFLAELRGDDVRTSSPRGSTRTRAPCSAVSDRRPKKALGQHFLVDENILRRDRAARRASPADVVLEVGPGLGVLTRFLADRVAHVHAVEIDRALEPQPAQAIERDRRSTGATRSALDLARARSASAQARREPAVQHRDPARRREPRRLEQLELWCVMVQREVADRFFAAPSTKAYGAVSVLVQLATERTGFHPVSREVFRPRPNVESALVAFRRIAPAAAAAR